jgi:hypothetical protein
VLQVRSTSDYRSTEVELSGKPALFATSDHERVGRRAVLSFSLRATSLACRAPNRSKPTPSTPTLESRDSVPTWRALGLPDDSYRGRRRPTLVEMRRFQDPAGLFWIIRKLDGKHVAVILPFLATIVKVAHAIELIALVFKGNATTPFFPELSGIDDAVGRLFRHGKEEEGGVCLLPQNYERRERLCQC